MLRNIYLSISSRAIYYGILLVLACLLAMAAIYVNNSMIQRYQSEIYNKTQNYLGHYHNQLFTNLQSHIQIVRGLPGVFAVNPQLTQDQYALAVSHLVADGSDIRNIAAAPDMVIRYVYPMESHEAIIGLDYHNEPEQYEAAQRARDTRKLVLAGPMTLKQGGIGLISRIPIFLHDDNNQEYFWGLVSAVIDIDRFFEKSGLKAKMPIQLAIRGKDSLGGDGNIFFGDPTLFDNPKLMQTLDLPEGRWILAAEPLGGWQSYPDNIWQQRVMIYGLATTIFLLLAGFLRMMLSASLANQKFRHLMERASVPYLLLDHEGRVSFINQAFTDAYGYSMADMQFMTQWTSIVERPKDYQGAITDYIAKHNEKAPAEITLQTKNGLHKVVLINISFVKDRFDSVMLFALYDISARKQAEEQLRFSSQVFNQAQEGIMITNTKGEIIDVNPAFTVITGYSRLEMLGQNPSMLSSGKHNPTFFSEMWQAIATDGYWQGEVWNRRKNGELYAELLSISALTDDIGECNHYVGLFSDITQTKHQQETLELMAHYDVLTKLPNRLLFADRFTVAAAHAERNNTLLAICFLDLDNFKPVNDNYGHKIGDQLLVEVAIRLKNNVRDVDTISRFGGDEFAIMFTDINTTAECEQLLTRLHQSIAQPYTIGDLSLKISASSGATYYPDDKADLDTLLRHADQAMYQAKLRGRNTFRIFNPMDDDQTIVKQHWIRDVQQALELDQFYLVYQPKVNMHTGVVTGMEALLRWQHPERGVMTPPQFLPEIEGSDVEIALGIWVLNKAFDEMSGWHQAGLLLDVGVNIASSHIQKKSFIHDIKHTLQQHPEIIAEYLQLEILETSELGDLNNILDVIKHCRDELGVSVALDDFGTGYSSLTHLRHLTAKTIKIDRSFIRDMLDDPQDFTIVDGIIGLAEAFDLDVIAEGVETTEHGLMLLLLGCERAQGYGIAKPMSADEVLPWVESYQPNPQWLACNAATLTMTQRTLALFQLASYQWFRQINDNVNEFAEQGREWPILDSTRCHCGSWIKRVRSQELFDAEWLDELKYCHEECHMLAKRLKQAHAQTQYEQQQELLVEFELAFADMQKMVEVELHQHN